MGRGVSQYQRLARSAADCLLDRPTRVRVTQSGSTPEWLAHWLGCWLASCDCLSGWLDGRSAGPPPKRLNNKKNKEILNNLGEPTIEELRKTNGKTRKA